MKESIQQSVLSARNGDPVALDSLFGRHMPQLVAFLRVKMGRLLAAKESVYDLAQSVCREVLEDVDQLEYQGEAAFHCYLMQQATRKILDKKRFWSANRRDGARESDSTDSTPSRADLESVAECCATLVGPSQFAMAREAQERLATALDQLSDTQREAVAMTRLLNLSYPEVARHLGLTESAVRGLVARGLARLSLMMGKPL